MSKAILRKNPHMTGGRILQVFQDVNMAQSFDGLEKLLNKERPKLSFSDLKEGEYFVFFNARRTYLKIAAANNVIASRRLPKGQGRFFDLTCIVAVVRAFHNTGEIQYDRELRSRLELLLQRKNTARTIEED